MAQGLAQADRGVKPLPPLTTRSLDGGTGDGGGGGRDRDNDKDGDGLSVFEFFSGIGYGDLLPHLCPTSFHVLHVFDLLALYQHQHQHQ